jgi:class 3 adenylate cyclase
MPRRPQTPERLLATVLFTDIIGSTERAAEVGDKQWRRLISAHHALVRRDLKRFNGREIDTAGDGFFATFDQPAQAIRCAEAIVADVQRLGIEIRAGVHMGEVEIIGPKVGGIAVHIGARIMSKAGPGQVLVSNTVRDLMAGSDLKFEDLGSHELKGIPAQWRLYAVEPALEPPPADEGPLVVVEERPGKRPFPWVLALIIGGVVLVLVIPPALVLTRRGGGPAFTVGPNTVARIDPTSGRVVGGAAVGTTPISIAFGDGTVWVANFDDRTLQPIDARTGVARAAFGGLSGNPSAVAVGGGYVWVTIFQGGALRIDPTQHNAVTPIDVGTGADGVAFGDGYAWITNSQDDTLTRVDPSTLELRAFQLDTGSQPEGVAVGAGSVWVAESLKGVVARVNETSGAIQPIPLLAGNPTQVAFGQGFVWATDMSDDSVFRIDPNGNGGTTIPNVGNGPEGISAGADGVWVANSLDGTVAHIRGTSVVQIVRLGDFSLEGVAQSPGAIWVSIHSQS